MVVFHLGEPGENEPGEVFTAHSAPPISPDTLSASGSARDASMRVAYFPIKAPAVEKL
jgi:hypothetical protein